MFALPQGAFVNPNRLQSIRHRRDFVAKRPEKLRSQFTDRFLIVHDEDALVIVMKWPADGAPLSGATAGIVRRAQKERENRSRAGRAFQQEQAAMFLDD